MGASIHPHAEIEDGVTIGSGTAIWSHVHVRAGAVIGSDCIIGEKTYVASGVTIGDRCKVNALVYLCSGVTLEDGVMVAASVTFTNDRFPRATTPDLAKLLPSEAGDDTLATVVRTGTTIGAGATVGAGFALGPFAMVGMGSVVTRPVAAHALVVGNPARQIGWVCRCGARLARVAIGTPVPDGDLACARCGWRFRFDGGAPHDLGPG